MLIEAGYPMRLVETPQRRTIETEETSGPADFCRRPTPGFVDVTSWGAVSGCGIMCLGGEHSTAVSGRGDRRRSLLGNSGLAQAVENGLKLG
jgi:hypothetical protein